MKFRALIHFKNDEEIASDPVDTFETAIDCLKMLVIGDDDYDHEDVQFWQIEPVT